MKSFRESGYFHLVAPSTCPISESPPFSRQVEKGSKDCLWEVYMDYACGHHFGAHTIIGQNLVTWSHLTSRVDGKYSIAVHKIV